MIDQPKSDLMKLLHEGIEKEIRGRISYIAANVCRRLSYEMRGTDQIVITLQFKELHDERITQ